MKALILCAALAAASFPALAQTNVSITVGQPGFYGRIDLGDRAYYGPPPVYVAQPIIVERHYRRHVRAEPIYLRVPPGHRKNWSKHCRKYGACGQPVLFVQDRWYQDVYAPRYREVHYRARHDDRGHGHGHGRGPDRHHDRGHGRGHDRDHDRGHGHGKGHGRGHD
ncbi:hypothetical protein LE190_10425 [Massilia oculi]|uniref:DUF3300 domain-containing protein n=1 Tax=Massilia hydrophila TaxID=3044279 RepID=A0ABS7Y9H4_9BURK|nr:hypothetical protein [Massilia oculi]MCA1856336.1 hypothetical protein [Massilia oculi]